MQFHILTIFPEAFESFKKTSLIGRAIEKKIIRVNVHDIRKFSTDKHKKVDDEPYGGGAGMVMMCQPIFDAIEAIQKTAEEKIPVIFFTPSNNIFDQKMAEDFSTKKFPEIFGVEEFMNKKIDQIILLCGHYEGIDQRIRDHLVDAEISVGNFVLTGGEVPAQIFIDCVARLIPGVIGKTESHENESFTKKLGRTTLEYPHYTRPENFRGFTVPDVLLSGHHAQIKEWRKNNTKNNEK